MPARGKWSLSFDLGAELAPCIGGVSNITPKVHLHDGIWDLRRGYECDDVRFLVGYPSGSSGQSLIHLWAEVGGCMLHSVIAPEYDRGHLRTPLTHDKSTWLKSEIHQVLKELHDRGMYPESCLWRSLGSWVFFKLRSSPSTMWQCLMDPLFERGKARGFLLWEPMTNS